MSSQKDIFNLVFQTVFVSVSECVPVLSVLLCVYTVFQIVWNICFLGESLVRILKPFMSKYEAGKDKLSIEAKFIYTALFRRTGQCIVLYNIEHEILI